MQRSSEPASPISIGPYWCGPGQPLLLIAGPCVIESPDFTLGVARQLRELTEDLPLNLVFKASFDKANRTRLDSFRGVGLEAGLECLGAVRQDLGVPVTTDIHEPRQAERAGQVCDLLQIPAFLSRQTDLLVAAAQTGRAVNLKKGQFMAPGDMQHGVTKLRDSGCRNVMVCERGTFFGYGRLVNDMRALVQMRDTQAAICFDATHSVQEPGSLEGRTGGQREMVEPLARAAMAIGIDALFLETHPNPDQSPSDGPNMVPLDQLKALLTRLLSLRATVEAFT